MKTMTSVLKSLETDDGYASFETVVRTRVKEAVGPLFDTDVKDLYGTKFLRPPP